MLGRCGWRRGRSGSLEESLDCYRQRSDSFADDLPGEIQIDVEVPVNEHIAKSGNASPVNIWKRCAQVLRYVFRRFPDDLEVPHDGIDRHLIGIELFKM